MCKLFSKKKEPSLNTIPVYPLSNISHLYRVRKISDFDKTDISQYGYIQDITKIKRYRLNKEGEQVLYTSSYPTIAERETIKEISDFFLIKYRKKTCDDQFITFIAIDNNCSKDSKSDTYILREKLRKDFSSEELKKVDTLRQILEKDYLDDDKEKYKESSECASRILKVADCIITYSKVGGNGNRHLNLTFNKRATDNLLEIETIYLCKAKEDKTSLLYNIIEIGIPKNSQEVEWFDFEINTEIANVVQYNGLVLSAQDILKLYNKKIMPHVNADINEEQEQTLNIPSKGTYTLRYSFKLIPIQ